MIRILSRNWLAKLGSVICAILLWLFVTSSNNVQASGEFTIPVAYNGISTDQVVRGAPASVLVKVIGRRNQLSSLTANNFSAFIDFTGTEGNYEKSIQVVLPSGVTQVSVTPATAIGSIEISTSKTVPVETSLVGLAPNDSTVQINIPIKEARVIGLSSSLEKVTKVIAIVDPTEGSSVVPLFAADRSNQPIRDSTLTVSPNSATVAVSFETILHSKRVSVALQETSLEDLNNESIGLSNLVLSQNDLQIVGPKDLIDSVDTITATVEALTGEIKTGEYTLSVQPLLPEGISTTEQLSLQLTLRVLDEPEPNNSPESPQDESQPTNGPNGVSNDSSSTTVRRPDPSQTSAFRNLFRR